MAVPPPLPVGENSTETQGSAENWDFPASTENQGAACGAVPLIEIDVRDVTFPKRDRSGFGQQRSKYIWLYVVECGEFTKVGIAGDPGYRLAGLAGSNPYDVILHNAYRVPRTLARLAEAWCHRKLIATHHRVEWFRVEPVEAEKVVKAIAERACAARRAKTQAYLPENDPGRICNLALPKVIRCPDSPLWVPFRGDPEWEEARRAANAQAVGASL